MVIPADEMDLVLNSIISDMNLVDHIKKRVIRSLSKSGVGIGSECSYLVNHTIDSIFDELRIQELISDFCAARRSRRRDKKDYKSPEYSSCEPSQTIRGHSKRRGRHSRSSGTRSAPVGGKSSGGFDPSKRQTLSFTANMSGDSSAETVPAAQHPSSDHSTDSPIQKDVIVETNNCQPSSESLQNNIHLPSAVLEPQDVKENSNIPVIEAQNVVEVTSKRVYQEESCSEGSQSSSKGGTSHSVEWPQATYDDEGIGCGAVDMGRECDDDVVRMSDASGVVYVSDSFDSDCPNSNSVPAEGTNTESDGPSFQKDNEQIDVPSAHDRTGEDDEQSDGNVVVEADDDIIGARDHNQEDNHADDYSDDFEGNVSGMSPSKDVEKGARRVTFVEGIVSDTFFHRQKYAPHELSELFYTHEEAMQFQFDFDREAQRADSDGKEWTEWIMERSEEQLEQDAIEDAAMQDDFRDYWEGNEAYEDSPSGSSNDMWEF